MNTQVLAQQRANMVEGQLRPNKVNNKPLLARFQSVAREAYVPSASTAYLDQPASLGQGREAFSPLVAARLIQSLNLQSEDTVLVAAAGTGYTTAIIAPLCQSVTAVEGDATLAQTATTNLVSQGFTNVQVVTACPTQGHSAAAPYSAMLIDAPFAEMQTAWLEQLTEGGRLAGVRVGADGIPEATLFTKHGNSLLAEVLFETKGTVHPAFTTTEKFVF